jgi:hypothetical protein
MAQLQHCENNLTQSQRMICLCSHAYLIPPSKSFLHYIVFLPAKALCTTLFLVSSDLKHTWDLVSDMHTVP